MSFVHLHVHSEYSLLDGANRISDLVRRAKEYEMPALALTDHGCLFGAWHFKNIAKKNDLKPIIGMEAYVAPGDRRDRSKAGEGEKAYYHLLLLARDMEGYHNLVKLSSIGYREGFYHRPRVDREVLQRYSGGIIVSSACMAGEVARHLLADDYAGARQVADWYANAFPDRYYLEVQAHTSEGQRTLNEQIFRLSGDLGLPVVATNDSHFLQPQDHEAHDVLLCIGLGKDKEDPNRMRYDDGLYFKCAQEISEFFPDHPEVLENTLAIADECGLDFKEQLHLPSFPLPTEYEDEGLYLTRLTIEGAEERYGTPLPDDVQDRLQYELGVILETGYAGYFLIVWEFIDWAKKQGIPVGPGRGSAAGSLVAYALGITNIDPLEFGLLFERFLNPERIEMPDIDIDFCYERRGEVIEHVRQKYGADAVGQIITFGTMKSRAVVRDVGRVLGFEPSETDKLAKMIPNQPGQSFTVEEAVTKLPEVKTFYEMDERHRKLFEYSMTLEGLSRHASVHAAGVVIAPGPLDEYVPVCIQSGKNGSGSNGEADADIVVTQYDMNALADAGMLKMDFLGLKTLTVIADASAMIRERVGELKHPDTGQVYETMDDVPLDDPAVYEMLSHGGTPGVFQFESSLATDKLRAMRCDRFDDLVATNALIRPGPLDSGMTDVYIRRKVEEEPVRYPHPDLKKVLEPTYGVIVYQEQVMRIANVLGGYSLAESDVLRKAVGKKIPALIRKELGKFVERAVERGVDRRTADDLAEQIETFGRYGFNLCLPGHVEVLDARTGRLVTMEELYRTRGQLRTVVSCDTDSHQLEQGLVANVMDNGVKPVWRVRTESGREIEATANHPFLTFDGWTNLEDLEVGTHVAVPRRLPVEGREWWPEHEVVALAHLMADGNTCHPKGLYVYNQEDALLDDFVAAAERFHNVRCTRGVHRGTGYVYTARIDRDEPNGIYQWARRLGLLGKTATEKEIPAGVFELSNDRIGLLLARMWEGDGHIGGASMGGGPGGEGHVGAGSVGAGPIGEDGGRRGRGAYYATSSDRLARQVQHLLLRLGILPRLRRVHFRYRGGHKPGFQIHVHGNEHLRTFAETIACHFVSEERRAQLAALVLEDPQSGPSRDVIPVEIRDRVRILKAERGVTWKEVEAGAGVSARDFYPVGTNPDKIGFTRDMIGKVAAFFEDEELEALAESDVLWDRVAGIEYVGRTRTYDLEVPIHHNFVANDIIVHNSHSASYSLLSYHTAWLKRWYPAEFMAALLSSVLSSTDDVVKYINECRELPRHIPGLEEGIEVLPPDVKQSGWKFTAVGDKQIRFGLGAVRGVGSGAVDSILDARAEGGEFTSLFDFLDRIDIRALNKRACEALIAAGALDAFGHRAQLSAGLDVAYGEIQARQAEREAGQASLFGEAEGSLQRPDPSLPEIPEWPEHDRLAREKEALGFFISGHPLERYREIVRAFSEVSSISLADKLGEQVELPCVVTKVAKNISRRDGAEWGKITVEDFSGTATVLAFGDSWAENRDVLEQDACVLIRGRVSGRERDEEDPPIFMDSAVLLEDVPGSGELAVVISLESGEELDAATWAKVKAIAEAHPGVAGLEVRMRGENGLPGLAALVLRSRTLGVEPTAEVLAEMRGVLGGGRVGLGRRGGGSDG